MFNKNRENKMIKPSTEIPVPLLNPLRIVVPPVLLLKVISPLLSSVLEITTLSSGP